MGENSSGMCVGGGKYRGQWEGPGYLSMSIFSHWVEEIYRAGVKLVLSAICEDKLFPAF